MIRDTVGQLSRSFHDIISEALGKGNTIVNNTVGTVNTGFSNIWAGGFTGMSKSGMEELKTSLTTYVKEVQEIIDGFDQTGDITSALKGDVQTAAYDFIAAIKELLKAYVSLLRQEIEQADKAYN